MKAGATNKLWLLATLTSKSTHLCQVPDAALTPSIPGSCKCFTNHQFSALRKHKWKAHSVKARLWLAWRRRPEKQSYQLARSPHLDCMSACAFACCCGVGWGGWHGAWSAAGPCGVPAWCRGAEGAGGEQRGCFWGCCCCLYRDRLKNRPRMALRFPFLISARQGKESC